MDIFILQHVSVAVTDSLQAGREQLLSLLAKSGFRRVTCYASVSQLPHRQADVLVVGPHVGEAGWKRLAGYVAQGKVCMHLVVCTGGGDSLHRCRALLPETAAYVSFPADGTSLAEAIVGVVRGERREEPQPAAAAQERPPQAPVLTAREMDVLRAVASGLSSKEIASRLFISESTVEGHRQRLFAKLGVRNVATLIVRAIAQGYIDPFGLDMA